MNPGLYEEVAIAIAGACAPVLAKLVADAIEKRKLKKVIRSSSSILRVVETVLAENLSSYSSWDRRNVVLASIEGMSDGKLSSKELEASFKWIIKNFDPTELEVKNLLPREKKVADEVKGKVVAKNPLS